MKRPSWLRPLLMGLGAYLLLIILIWQAETLFAADQTDIKGPFEALWYSLVTLTTVGYGDMAPVSLVGRLLSLPLVLASIGVLGTVISLCLELLRGQLLPRLRLWLGRDRDWYLFPYDTPESRALGRDLLAQNPEALLLFPPDTRMEPCRSVIPTGESWDTLAKLRCGMEGLTLCCLGEDPWRNYAQGLTAAQAGIPVYAMADALSEHLPPTLHLFQAHAAMARCYWQAHPLGRRERRVVLLGTGQRSEAILTQALLVNVFPSRRPVQYHVFGADPAFVRLHRGLWDELGPDGGDGDRLTFHEESFEDRADLLAEADRVILAAETDRETLELCRSLRTWFVCPGQVHLLLSEKIPGLTCFGEAAEIFTVETVMQDRLNRQARALHAIYQENNPAAQPWEDLSPFLQRSNMAAADHVSVKVRCLLGLDQPCKPSADELELAYQRFCAAEEEEREALRRCEHRRWMRFHLLYHWTWAAQRSNELHRHNLLVPYEQLSAEQQAKDDYPWELLHRLAEQAE